jgi:hypothetical protein
MRSPSAAPPATTVLSLVALFTLADCDADGGEQGVLLRSFESASLIAEQVYEPTPGGGGCEGCVTCFARLGTFGGLCLASDASYTGRSLAADDDIDLASLLRTPALARWQMYSASGGPSSMSKSDAMCLADGCASKSMFSQADSAVELWVPLRPGQPNAPPRGLWFNRIGQDAAAALWPWGLGPWIGVREGIGALPSVLGAVPSGHADQLPTPNPVSAAMAHITYPSDAGGLVSCSGFVVSQRHVLTAAHCFARDPESLCTHRVLYYADIPDELDIRIGGIHSPSHPQFETDSRHTAEAIEFHCDPAIDLALITLAEPTCADPLPLAEPAASGTWDALPATAYGYGVSRMPDSFQAERYDWGRLKRMPLATADLLSGTPESPYLLTFRATGGSIGVCRGDSGGPVLRAIDGQQRVVGVMFARVLDPAGNGDPDEATLEAVGGRSFAWSRHNVCGDGPLRGFVAMRVNHPDLHAWVSQRIDGYEEDPCGDLPSPLPAQIPGPEPSLPVEPPVSK